MIYKELGRLGTSGGASAQGAITGGVAGFTAGGSLLVTAAAGGVANGVGGAANNAIQGKEITGGSVAKDVAIGSASAVVGGLANKALGGEGVIYLRTDKTAGGMKPYVGQAKSAEHYAKRQTAHAKNNPKADFEFKKIDKGKPGKDLNQKEQKHIDSRGGVTNKSNPNGKLSNHNNVIKKDKKQ